VTEPVITLQHFFERAREGELTAIKCSGCGALAIPPKEFCTVCHQRAWQPILLSGDGTIASYTVIRVAPRAHTADVPYAIAAVQLREGVSLLGRVVDLPLDKLAIGLPVRFRPLVAHGVTAVGFAPA
jgi:3-oxo-4,17-pregnadiene-20-carboxyl-CoA hydratase alpha subunit